MPNMQLKYDTLLTANLLRDLKDRYKRKHPRTYCGFFEWAADYEGMCCEFAARRMPLSFFQAAGGSMCPAYFAKFLETYADTAWEYWRDELRAYARDVHDRQEAEAACLELQAEVEKLRKDVNRLSRLEQDRFNEKYNRRTSPINLLGKSRSWTEYDARTDLLGRGYFNE